MGRAAQGRRVVASASGANVERKGRYLGSPLPDPEQCRRTWPLRAGRCGAGGGHAFPERLQRTASGLEERKGGAHRYRCRRDLT